MKALHFPWTETSLIFICLSLDAIKGVIAQCNWTFSLGNTVITDLRTPTPLDYTFTLDGISNCELAPTTGFAYYTAIANGIFYTEQTPMTFVYSVQTLEYYTVQFPELLITNLTPGQSITIVWSETLIPPSSATGGFGYSCPIPSASYNSLTVGQNAITSSTSSSTTYTTSPTTPTPTQSSGTATGAIVGGVVGGVAGIAILAIALWAFLQCRRRRDMAETNPAAQVYPRDKTTDPSISSPTDRAARIDESEMEEFGTASGRLRYPI